MLPEAEVTKHPRNERNPKTTPKYFHDDLIATAGPRRTIREAGASVEISSERTRFSASCSTRCWPPIYEACCVQPGVKLPLSVHPPEHREVRARVGTCAQSRSQRGPANRSPRRRKGGGAATGYRSSNPPEEFAVDKSTAALTRCEDSYLFCETQTSRQNYLYHYQTIFIIHILQFIGRKCHVRNG